MNIFGSFMNNIDSPQLENNENQIEAIVTQTYIEGSQSPITNTIVTKTYDSGDKLIHQATNNAIFNNKLLENDGKQKIENIINEMKNESNSDENSVNDSDVEDYGSDNNNETMNDDNGTMNDNDGDMIDDENYDNDDKNNNVQIKEEDFNKVMQDSMALQVS